MIAGIMLSRKQVHAFLKSLGHKPTKETFDEETGFYRFWITPWGKYFPVPDKDFTCAHFVLTKIAEDIGKTKPPE
jgi:hypothetical protein